MNAKHPKVLVEALRKTIVGQRDAIDALLLGLIGGGHVLLEGPPGLAKTLACRALAAALAGSFKRVQFTPDLLPADIIGTRIFDQHEAVFSTVLGPLFANIVLADEVNRAPAKVQSALLEAMQERQVTIGPQTHALPDPFLVLATMNPYDADGTYALPAAQLDRFLLSCKMGFPTFDQECEILERFAVEQHALLHAVASLDDVRDWREQARRIDVDERIKRYAVSLAAATRAPSPEHREYIEFGVSPRATLALLFVARAKALLCERSYVLPDDVRDAAPLVFRHRIGFTHRVEMDRVDPDTIVAAMVAGVGAP